MAAGLLVDLLDEDGPPADALETILESGDQRFVSVLLELMRARRAGRSSATIGRPGWCGMVRATWNRRPVSPAGRARC
jgi:hypothetical protein